MKEEDGKRMIKRRANWCDKDTADQTNDNKDGEDMEAAEGGGVEETKFPNTRDAEV